MDDHYFSYITKMREKEKKKKGSSRLGWTLNIF
jgi:hypothetical protein